MNATLKAGLIIAAKQAVQAILIALGPVLATPSAYNLTTKTGIEHVLILAASSIVSRELVVWVPKLAAWANS